MEGFYLLRSIPHSDTKFIPPQEFPENARDNIVACLNCVNSHFSNAFEIRKEWEEWAQVHCPTSDSAIEYVQHLRLKGVGYHIPLKVILLDRQQIIRCPAWKDKPLKACPISNQTIFQWPEVLSAATHSVRTSMNMHPQPSRLYVPRDEQLVMELNIFMANVGPVHYDTVLRGNTTTKERLKDMIDRTVGYSGEVPSKTGILSSYN